MGTRMEAGGERYQHELEERKGEKMPRGRKAQGKEAEWVKRKPGWARKARCRERQGCNPRPPGAVKLGQTGSSVINISVLVNGTRGLGLDSP